MKFIQPPHPYQGPRYTELEDDNMETYFFDQFYALNVGKRDNHINPTTNVLVGSSV